MAVTQITWRTWQHRQYPGVRPRPRCQYLGFPGYFERDQAAQLRDLGDDNYKCLSARSPFKDSNPTAGSRAARRGGEADHCLGGVGDDLAAPQQASGVA
jgi:hypothetical protein